MKKDFVQLVKDLRITFRPAFYKVVNAEELSTEQKSQALTDLEVKQEQALIEAGYTFKEFDSLLREYFMDLSSENPDEWIIRHDPENAIIITHKY